MADQAQLVQVPFNAYPWQAGHTYSPGDVVTPTTAPNTGAINVTNSDFVANITGWTSNPGGAFTWSGAIGYNGLGAAQLAASTNATLINSTKVAVVPGQSITCSCFVGGTNNTLASGVATTGFVTLTWYDASSAVLSTSNGSVANGARYTALTQNWAQSTLTDVAPPNAAFVAIGVSCTNTSPNTMGVDTFAWNYQGPASTATASAAPQYFTSIAAAAATSGPSEPDWTNGGSGTGNVADGGVTWARGAQSVIFWRAQALCQSSGVKGEPVWPTGQGKMVTDGDSTGFSTPFHWQSQTPAIQDANCPNTIPVIIAASKVFAGSDDIVRYSATSNPMDWSATADAGYLPTGLQTYGANSVTALGLYRTSLVVFNSQACQIWQIDEDPANMSLLDAIGIGCSYPKTVVPVNADLFWLADEGVRSMIISGGSGNTQAGDIGMPIDPLVLAGIAYCNANGTEPIAEYIPALGQAWFHFPGWNAAGFFKSTPNNTSNVFVYSMTRQGQVGAWSRYNFPMASIDNFCLAGSYLYLQCGDDTLRVDPAVLYDYFGDTYNNTSRQQTFQGVVQWPWLDCESPGVTKMLHTIDIVSTQNTQITVEIGYDQTNPTTAYTTPFTMPADSVPGLQIPIPIMAASFSPRLTMVSTDSWSIKAVNLQIQDMNINA